MRHAARRAGSRGAVLRTGQQRPARVQAGRREGGRRRAGKRRSTDASKTGWLGRPGAESAPGAESRPDLESSVGASGRVYAGGRVGEPLAPAKWRQLSYWLIVAGTGAALVIMRLGPHQLKSGTLVFAGVLLIAAIARLVLPDRLAGMLSSRRRLLDVAIFAVLGIGLLAAGLGVQAPG